MLGARLRKLDLHVHTPSSRGFKESGATAADIVTAALAKQLDAMAVTDHNSIAWVEVVRSEASSSSLVVFPGFELNSRGGHLIALFDPSSSMSVLETTLIQCGVPKQNWGDEAYMGKDIEAALAAIASNGGIAIAAHADGPKGFLKAMQQGVARIKIFNDGNLSALEIVSPKKRAELAGAKVKGYERSIALIEGSDAHSIADIGKRSTYLRMDRISLEGIRQAFADPDLRVRQVGVEAAMVFPHVESLSVDKGFLGGQEIQLNSSLNCLVGGAGTGKSTIIEFMRFALDQRSAVETISLDCIGKLSDLAGIGATISVGVCDASEQHYRISRVFDDADNPISVIRLSDNKEIRIADIRSFFPIHAYSQGEVIAICRSPLAQLGLIDSHLDLKAYMAEIQQSYEAMRKQASLLAKTEASTKNRQAIEREISDLDSRAEILSAELARLKGTKKDKVVHSHPLWLAEEGYWNDLVEAIQLTRDSIAAGIDEIDLPLLQVSAPDQLTPNKGLIQRCQTAISKLEEARERAKSRWLAKLDEIGQVVTKHRGTWSDAFAGHQSQYRKAEVEKRSKRTSEVVSQLTDNSGKKRSLQKQLRSVTGADRALKLLLREREEHLRLIQDRKNRIRILRERKAKEILKQIGDRVSLRYVHDGNREKYERLLVQLLKGTYAPKSVTESIAASAAPPELVKLVRPGDNAALSAACGIDARWAQTLHDKLAGDPDTLYLIEATPIEDLVEISFKVAEGEYRALDKLSTGQKATVIVLLAMVEGVAPIIFDQPEDALYTPFIYTDVVKAMRRGKDKRQFILATHNPNIAVGGDADLGIVLEGTAKQTTIRAAGGLDDEETRGLLLWHLEGGEKAFRSRHIKFGLK